jgi:hypothetical protein
MRIRGVGRRRLRRDGVAPRLDRQEVVMAVQVPFHPGASVPKTQDPVQHEPLDDILEEEGSSKTQRWIGWFCALLTAGLVYAVWRLL